MERMSMDNRWRHAIVYRLDEGRVQMEHYAPRGLHEPHELIEGGPHWGPIIKIEVRRANHIDDPSLTVDRAEEL
jgi:hypothetical protein